MCFFLEKNLLGFTRLEERGEREERRRSRLEQQLEEAQELRRRISSRSRRVEEVVAAKLARTRSGSSPERSWWPGNDRPLTGSSWPGRKP